MTTFELCKEYARRYNTKMAELCEYQKSWGPEFVSFQISEFVQNLQSLDGYKKIDPNDLTKDQLISLGGCLWNDKTNLVLLPLWMRQHLVDKFNGGSILDETETIIESKNINNDNRFGALAYGVFID